MVVWCLCCRFVSLCGCFAFLWIFFAISLWLLKSHFGVVVSLFAVVLRLFVVVWCVFVVVLSVFQINRASGHTPKGCN